MNFDLNETQRAVQQSFQEFVDREVRPMAAHIDEQKTFPRELFHRVGELGFFGMRYPEEAGGTGMDVVSYCLAVSELARGSLSLAAVCTMQSLMGTWFLHRFGNQQIREDYFDKALTGDKIGALCMTEPGAGSDLNAISSRAKPSEEGYLLTGNKTWVTSAPNADFFTVLCKTTQEQGLSLFFVPANLDGVVVGRSIEKLGVRGSPTSEVSFEEVLVPRDYLLGELGQGGQYLREILAEIRITTAALALGVGTAAFEEALEYAKTRCQFGKPISKFQAIKIKFADMAVQLETSRQMLFHTARLSDAGAERISEASMLKLYVSECANSICDQASRILASYGYAMEYNLQRYLRDVRFTLIGGGTSEILRLQIAKELGL